LLFGGTNFANLSIKDILEEPIKMKAPKIILVHNHPSGDATILLGIQLLDHLVIGNKTYTSIFSKMISETKD